MKRLDFFRRILSPDAVVLAAVLGTLAALLSPPPKPKPKPAAATVLGHLVTCPRCSAPEAIPFDCPDLPERFRPKKRPK